MDKPIIRLITKVDNAVIAGVIREVLTEHGVPKVGTAYEDAALDAMFETYDVPQAAYFVVEAEGVVLGGGGVAQLANYEGNVCELQKMYFLKSARGRGLGSAMIEKCLHQAREFGYAQCYLETMPYMEAARKLYQRTGFQYIDGPMGDTGHFSCQTHMLIDL